MDGIIISIGIAAVCALAGLALFVPGSQTLESKLKENSAEKPDAPTATIRHKRWYLLGMAVSCFVIAPFLAGFYHQAPLVILRTVLLCALLWVCAWTDMQAFLIPNRVLLFGLLLRAVLLAVEAAVNWNDFLYTVFSALIGSAILGVIAGLCRVIASGGIGWGDIKLMMVMGLYLGTEYMWNAMFFALVGSFVASIVLILFKKAKRDTLFPFAPFLLLGTQLAAILTGI